MISIESAIERVHYQCRPLAVEPSRIHEACGRVVAEDVRTSECSPPFTKSLVDGFAIRTIDIDQPSLELPVAEQVIAGDLAMRLPERHATQIMTGAPVPEGADCVIMVEETSEIQRADQRLVVIQKKDVKPGRNILNKGSVVALGDTLVKQGEMITASGVGALAEFGLTELSVYQRPRVAILTTGNELVDCTRTIEGAQIRNSNGPMLSAHANARACLVSELGIVGDDPVQLTEKIRKGLEHDILVISGGVSAGVMDLVPDTLESLGVKKVFHKVALKPGKPVWFGVLENDLHRCLVFGLPGNPVSALVCFLIFVAPAVDALRQKKPGPSQFGFLKTEFKVGGNRPTFWPAAIELDSKGRKVIVPLDWKGSADLVTAAKADAFAYFERPGRVYAAQEQVSLLIV